MRDRDDGWWMRMGLLAKEKGSHHPTSYGIISLFLPFVTFLYPLLSNAAGSTGNGMTDK